MTTKKKPSKKMKKKKPTKAMLKEIGEVLQKHNSNGVTLKFSDSVGSVALSGGAVADSASGLAPTAESLNCTPPKSPTFVCKTLADGTIVCGFVCR